MQKRGFVLSFFLLLSERLACYGSTTPMANEETSGDGTPAVQATLGPSTPTVFMQAVTTVSEHSEMGHTTTMNTDESETLVSPALLYGISAALLLILLLLSVFLIVRCRKQKQSKQDELGSENCKSPIFEEDTPSVMEIEMEELDKWMNSLKRNAECEYLPPVKEEKDWNANASDCES